ncbi:YopX family protein [Bacillus paranthracis]|uniref:YopX family protein n=1 Tax=Bacillus TaxID=1386 RepID=UPI000CCC17A9|nr:MULTISPECIES: YopX family protein [Bacillus]MDO3374561.1 YopX family protein [Bacillus paranthracis]PNS32750.1 hypothetical protein C1640_09495 [Bacillus sp. AKBS9]
MREIKFRAWDGASWIYSECVSKDNDVWRILNHEDDEWWACLEPQQYTGLKDKNGKEIYEGDIVYFIMPDQNYVEKGNGWEGINTHKGFEVTGEVKFIDGGWFIDKGDESGVLGVPLYFDGEQIVEVKDNIYENPELLER